VAARIASLPNSLVTGTLRPVFFHHASNSDLRSLEVPILSALRALGIMSVLFLVPCAAQATWLTTTVLGSKWGDAAPFIVVLCIPTIPLLMGNWLDRMFDVLGQQRVALKLQICFSVIAMTSLVIAYFATSNLFWAVCAQNGLLFAYDLFWLGVLFRLAGFQLAGLLRVAAEIAAAGAGAVAVSWLLAESLPPAAAFISSIIGACVGSAWCAFRAWKSLPHAKPSSP
jgi:O-antigen/teichoic acid export membrane protein